jgi:predicted AlkP superfamily phosphohydrolase/phosphomutase
VILNRVDQKDWDLMVGVIESTDRVQHMMWRLIDPQHPLYDAALAAQFGDSIERVYRRADDFVGEIVRRVGPDVPVMIVSDHGFHSWRKAVNLDTWLVQNGYMVMKGQRRGQEALGLVRRRHLLGERGLDPHARLRDGHRPDLFQPPRP